MMFKKILLAAVCCAAWVAHAENNTVSSVTLFDFVQSPNINGWTTQEWIKGKNNTPGVKFDKLRGLHLIFPQENVTERTFRAPNINYRWQKAQDWSEYNFLVVDIYNPSGESDRIDIDLVTENGTREVSHHKIFVPSKQQIQFKIPLSVYQSWKLSPANLKKVRQINLIRRAPPRELNFYIRSIKLLKLSAPERQYQFDGLKAWQFGSKKRALKQGFEMITPDSPFWSQGERIAVETLPPENADCLWNSIIAGSTPAEITLPVAEDGEYVVFALLQGRSAFRYDTVIKVNDSPEYRHIIANAYPEYRLFKTRAQNRQIKVYLRPGSKEFQWGITALVVMPAEKADMMLDKFVWPAYDDMTVAPWALRSFLAEKKSPETAAFTAWDFYNHDYIKTDVLKHKTFSYMPQENGWLKITCPDGYQVKRAIDYTRVTYDGYVRQPRFFGTVKGEFSVRKGMREHFLLVPPTDAPAGKLEGELIISNSKNPEAIKIPFQLDNSRVSEADMKINYFLYYYPFQLTGSPLSIKAQRIQEHDEMVFMRSQGFKSLQVPMVASIKVKDGKFTYNFDGMISFLRKYHKIGFDTTIPMPLYLYNQIHTINRHIGGQKYLYSGEKLEQSVKAVQDFVKQADAALKKESFCPPAAWYPFDEFGNYPYVSRIHRAIREVGGITYSTSVGRYGNGYDISTEDGLSIYCFPRMGDNTDTAKLRQDIKKINSLFWRYTIECSDPVMERYSWGLASWAMGVSGHGAWHFGPHKPSLSELQKGSYYYAYGMYGAGEVMPALSMLAVRDAMQDYAALTMLEKSGRESDLLKSLRSDVDKLGPAPTEQAVRQWFFNGGREKMLKVRQAALSL